MSDNITTPNLKPQRNDNVTVLLIAAVFMLLTLLPYIYGAVKADGRYYTAFHYNQDDFCVYTAWMTQAENGHFFFDNRFTTDPQPRKTVHLFFWTLGTINRLFHLPPQVILHIARFLFGILLIFAFYRLAKRLLTDKSLCVKAVWLLILSAGFGWMMLPDGGMGWNAPADTWQPELLTFPSLYFNPLFCVSGWLMLEIMIAVLSAENNWQSVPRGMLFALLLANIHTYDIVTLATACVGFAVMKLITRKMDWQWFGRTVLIGLGSVPSLLWFLYVYSIDPVFQFRAATLTFSEPVWKYFLGFGLLIPLAVYAIYTIYKKKDYFSPSGRLLLPVWAILGFIIPYIPALFQRKLWMGEHYPLVMLTAGALSALLVKIEPLKQRLIFIIIICLLMPTNIYWVYRDMAFLSENRSNTGMHTPYLSKEQWDVITYLKNNTNPDDGVIAYPWEACYISAYAGNFTYASHWSETPEFEQRFAEVIFGIMNDETNLATRYDLLRKTNAVYLVMPADVSAPFELGNERQMRFYDFSMELGCSHKNNQYAIFNIQHIPAYAFKQLEVSPKKR